jgi:NADH:ubiquinone oxidoreductase subunit H
MQVWVLPFFLLPNTNIIFMAYFTSILFLGGWTSIYLPIGFIHLKAVFILILFIWVRAAFPRYRYDQLMALTWMTFLPFTLAFYTFAALMSYIQLDSFIVSKTSLEALNSYPHVVLFMT